jgi:hypothetical protein
LIVHGHLYSFKEEESGEAGKRQLTRECHAAGERGTRDMKMHEIEH